MKDLIGQQLGNYWLVSVLGRSGFAEVYLSHHVRQRTQAAIKVLHTHLSPEEISEFQGEAQMIANLVHPHIVRVLDFGVSNSIPFLVMDYCPRGTLRRRHSKGERIPLPTVISYVQQVTEALQYAHDHQLIHRAIKPENMLIGQHNAILLSDFGIAATAHSTSSMSTQVPVGTVPYMAPEQIQAQARPASDQYALGVVVYEWLCGARPFEGSSPEIFAKHLMIPPLPLRQKEPTLPLDVEHVVLRALAKDPSQRFASMQAFATALEQASQTQQVAPMSPQQNAAPPRPTLPPARTVLPPPAQALAETGMLAVQPPPPGVPAMTPTPPDSQAKRTSPMDKHSVSERQSFSHAASRQSQHRYPPYIYRGHGDWVYAVAWSPDSKLIASASNDKTVQVWDIAGHVVSQTYRGHSAPVRAVAWSPNGQRIASSDKLVQVWSPTDSRRVSTYRGHAPSLFHAYLVLALAWSPDSKLIASTSNDKTVQIWDARNGDKVYTYTGHPTPAWAVAWSPDGQFIASASEDKTVQVWNTAGHAYTYRGHSAPVRALVWSPDGQRIVSASSDHTVQLWNAVNGGKVSTYRGHSAAVWAVAWSPDGERIASASEDRTVQVWQAP